MEGELVIQEGGPVALLKVIVPFDPKHFCPDMMKTDDPGACQIDLRVAISTDDKKDKGCLAQKTSQVAVGFDALTSMCNKLVYNNNGLMTILFVANGKYGGTAL